MKSRPILKHPRVALIKFPDAELKPKYNSNVEGYK